VFVCYVMRRHVCEKNECGMSGSYLRALRECGKCDMRECVKCDITLRMRECKM